MIGSSRSLRAMPDGTGTRHDPPDEFSRNARFDVGIGRAARCDFLRRGWLCEGLKPVRRDLIRNFSTRGFDQLDTPDVCLAESETSRSREGPGRNRRFVVPTARRTMDCSTSAYLRGFYPFNPS
jgi:hypothetical protein